MRASIAAALLVACGGARTETEWVELPAALPTQPRCLAPRPSPPSGDVQLDALAFLEGGMSFYDVDWGQIMEVRRASDGWDVVWSTIGPMAVEGDENFRIHRVDGVLVLECRDTCEREPITWVEGDAEHAVFGEGDQRITFRRIDTCTISVAYADGSYVQQFVRPRP